MVDKAKTHYLEVLLRVDGVFVVDICDLDVA
jgi:hypothetical protein